MTSSTALTGKQRRYLRSLAHHLRPVVQIGQAGINEAQLAQIDKALETHELIKVKLGRETPVTPEEAGAVVTASTRSHLVQIIGRTLVVYRARAKDPDIVLPAPAES